jgi:general secretion pathway protein K
LPRPSIRIACDTPRPNERGIALLIVLWMLALLALVIAGFTLTSHTDIQLGRNQVDSARARALADAGVARAVIGLNEPDAAHRWLADGRPYDWRFGGGDVAISIQDEGGKINLNAASEEVLKSAFAYIGAADDLGASLAQAIVDRRAPTSLEEPATNGPAFAVMEDFETLPGMTPQIYYRIAPLVTVYGQSELVDMLTASRDVLLALPDADPNEIDEFLAARATQGTPDAEPLPAPLSVRRYLTQGSSGTVTIRARATTDTGAVFIRDATIRLQGDAAHPFITQAWRQEIALP